MWRLPGAISARPRSTASPSAASFTSISHSPSSRRANASVNFSGICCTMTMPGLATGSASKTTRSDSVPPVEAPMHTTRSVVRAIAWLRVGGGSITSALSFGGRHGGERPGHRQPLQSGVCRRLHRLADARARFAQELRRAQPRLQDHVHRAGLQCLHQRLRALFGQRGAHHHRDRPLRHQLAQEGDAVHARHLDIQRDYVGHFGLDAPRGNERVRRGADHLIPGSLDSTSDNVCRTTAESSTISTRTVGFITGAAARCWRRSATATPCRRAIPNAPGTGNHPAVSAGTAAPAQRAALACQSRSARCGRR